MSCSKTPAEIVVDLALHVKRAVVPHMGTWRARRVTGIANSGDATFSIDDVAEDAIVDYLKQADVDLAYYSEDRGLILPDSGREPVGMLIIDPIDGTRAAMAGFEACVVSVAWADYSPAPTLKNVRYGALAELKGGRVFCAERGQGARIVEADGTVSPVTLSPETCIDTMSWATEVVGAPTESLFPVLSRLANRTTVKGGMFILNSSAYEMTRLVTGQLSAIVDVRNRLLRERPETRERFREHGGGRLLSLYGYDMAAAGLLLTEAGGVMTDAWGNSLGGWNLLDTTERNFGSLIAAGNRELHAAIVNEIDAAFSDATD